MKRLLKQGRYENKNTTLITGLGYEGTLSVGRVLFLSGICMLATELHLQAAAQEEVTQYEFDIESATLGEALDEIVRITGAQLIFPHSLADATDIHSVIGQHSVEEALGIMLEDTRFSGGLTKGGMIVISLDKVREEDVAKGSTKRGLFASIPALLFGVGGPAIAQVDDGSAEAEVEQSRTFDTVIVTAQKREQNADDIGMAISVVGGDALEQLGVNNTADLALVIPGFTYSDTGFSTPVYTIRGVGFNEASVQATSTVGVYNDQIAVPFPIMSAGLQMDIGRVEVLKGPQGTLYGRNSTGGAINYIANRPSDEFEASILADYGSFETLDLTGVMNIPVADKLNARVAVRSVQSGEGWQESVTSNETLGEQDKLAARLLLDFAPSEDLEFNFVFSHWQDKSDTQAPQFWKIDNQRPTRTFLTQFLDSGDYARVPLFGTDDNQAADWTLGNNRLNAPVADMSSQSLSATVAWDINDSITLTSLSAFSQFKNNSSYDNSGWSGVPLDYELNGLTPRGTITPVVRDLYDQFDTLGGVGYTNDAEIDAFSQEFRLNGSTGNLTWLAGVYYSSDEVVSNTPQLVEFNTSTNLVVIGLQGVENPTRQEGKTWSAFGHTEWALSDALNLTVGLRYTEDEKDFEGCTADTGDGDLADFFNQGGPGPFTAGTCNMFGNGAPQNGPFMGELNEDSLSWRLGLDYELSDDTLLYASYSRGFKSGSFPTLTASVWDSLFPVVQEQLDAFEVGVKTELFNGAMQFNGAAFFYDYTDKQLFSKTIVPPFGAANVLANIPESTVSGAEFDIGWYPTNDLYIGFGGTYVTTEVEEFQGYSQVGIEGDFAGSEFPLTPEFQGFALVNYDFDLTDSLDGFVNFNASYSSESFSDYSIAEVLDSGGNGSRYGALLARNGVAVGDSADVADVFVLPETVQLGFRAGITSPDDQWTLSVWGRNLTDEYIVTNSRKSSDAILAYTGRPRTFGVSLGYNF